MTQATLTRSRWDGGTSPFGVSWQKMMMWWFIVSDGLLFAGFLVSYGFCRLASETWPDRHLMFHMSFITAMTFILISSSASMAMAVASARVGDRKAVSKLLLWTILGGLTFLGMQAFEWSSIIGQGARLTTNPWGVPAFSMYFFLITGFHGTHVAVGVTVLLCTLLRFRAGLTRPEGVEMAGLYWHFVDLVWVFVFGCFYLI